MSNTNISTLINLWAVLLLEHGDEPPFVNYNDLLNVIGFSVVKDVLW
jgi:hypothetical protein